ncbi:unnamed protein product, partial [Allacma fusca]
WMILRHLHGNQRKEFLQHFFAVTEINLFKQTLQFLDELLLQNFLLNWCCYFCECSTQLVEFPDLKKLLFDNTDFIDTLLSITYLSLEFLSSVYTSNVISEVAQADMVFICCMHSSYDIPNMIRFLVYVSLKRKYCPNRIV